MMWLLNILGKKKKEGLSDENKICGTEPSPPDGRDYVCTTSEDYELPEIFEPDNYETKSQGSLGSCSAFATCSAYEIMNAETKNRALNLSELFLWFNTRMGNSPSSGAVIRDVLQYVKDNGIGLEIFCPYDITRWNTKPSWNSYFSARYFRIKNYFRIPNFEEAKKSILDGSPVIIGMNVYSDMISTRGRVIQKPSGRRIGGHAMTLVGWCPKGFYVLNSWNDGVLILPYGIAESEIFEMWRINL